MAQRMLHRPRDQKEHKEEIGVYLRTGDSDSTLRRQKSMYATRIGMVPSWNLAGFYTDPGSSEDKAMKRTDLQRLIRDCWNGKVTHIVTNSIASLSTKAEELSSLFQILNSLPQPVGVYFEQERLDSQGREDTFASVL